MAERVHGTACRACGNRAHNTTLRAREMMVGRRDTFDYVRCAECGALSLVDVPEHLGDFYPPECYSFDAPAVEMRRPFVAGNVGLRGAAQARTRDLAGSWDLLMFNHSLEEGRTDAAGFVLVAIEGAA